MTFLFAIVAIAVIALIAMAASGHFENSLEPAPSTRPAGDMPNFDVTFRGYRMDEVDAVLAAKDEQLGELRAELDARQE